MKSMLVIGAGKYGTHLVKQLAELGNEIMLVDRNEKSMEGLLPFVTDAKIGDCTDERVLRSLGIPSFDICFVCLGDDFQATLEVTDLLKSLGAKYVVSKAVKNLHVKFLLKNGADEVVYPDRDIAEKNAIKYSSDQVFDFVELDDGYCLYEIAPEKKWEGKTIREVSVRKKYGINIAAIKTKSGINVKFNPEYVFRADEHLLVIGHRAVIAELVKKY